MANIHDYGIIYHIKCGPNPRFKKKEERIMVKKLNLTFALMSIFALVGCTSKPEAKETYDF